MSDEHGRRDPPPGWEYYEVTDDDGCQWPSANVRRIGPDVMSCDEAWARHNVSVQEGLEMARDAECRPCRDGVQEVDFADYHVGRTHCVGAPDYLPRVKCRAANIRRLLAALEES